MSMKNFKSATQHIAMRMIESKPAAARMKDAKSATQFFASRVGRVIGIKTPVPDISKIAATGAQPPPALREHPAQRPRRSFARSSLPFASIAVLAGGLVLYSCASSKTGADPKPFVPVSHASLQPGSYANAGGLDLLYISNDGRSATVELGTAQKEFVMSNGMNDTLTVGPSDFAVSAALSADGASLEFKVSARPKPQP